MTTPIELTFEVGLTVGEGSPRALTKPLVGLGQFEVKGAGAVAYLPGPDQLAKFYLDLIGGRPLAPKMVLARIEAISHLVALALFMDREVALHPRASGLVNAVTLMETMGCAGAAHCERDTEAFLRFIWKFYLGQGEGPSAEEAQRVTTALTWVREFILDGRLPAMPSPPNPPKVLDIGTNGFVVAEVRHPMLYEAVVELYRWGYLRGVVYFLSGSRTKVLAFRKSAYLQFNLGEARIRLNGMEQAAGDPPEWIAGDLFLSHQGSAIPQRLITEVLLRV